MATLSLIISVLVVLGLIVAGLVLRIYLPTYFAAKARNLAKKEDIEDLTRKVELVKHEFTAEVERLKAGLDRATHVSKRQFDVEFAIYRDVWEKLVVLRQAFFALRPFVSEIVPAQVGQERLQRRIDAFNSAYAEFVNAADRNQPFYSGEVYRELSAIIDICIDEKFESEFPDAEKNYWQRVRDSKQKLLKSIDTAYKAIRARFQHLVSQ
jgi:hypothetical protein